MKEPILQPYDGEAVDRAYRDLMLRLRERMDEHKVTVSALEKAGLCHHASLVLWLRLERNPCLSSVARAFGGVGLELWIVPKAGCRYPAQPMRVEPWDKHYQIAFGDFLSDALDACRVRCYHLKDYVNVGRNGMYNWLQGTAQPKALTLFRVLNLLGYTMEARNKEDAGG